MSAIGSSRRSIKGKTPQGGHVKGTGIGLSVVTEFVNAHGGSIEILESKSGGAHFRVRLPLRQPAPPRRAKKLMPRNGYRIAACALPCPCLGRPAAATLGQPQDAAPAGRAGAPQADTSPVAPLLEMMSNLPQGDPARQAEIFQQAKDAAELQPTTSNRLRYALALATPGYSGADPVAAQRQLAELLARPETLLPVERLLATVELKEVEQRLILQAENERMRDTVPNDSHDKLQAINRRLAAETDENAKLRKALDEARAKLEAVTHIEQRSVTDRGTGAPHTP